MESTVPFERVVEAFLQAAPDEFHFITENSLVIEESIGIDEVKRKSGPGYTCLPKRTADFDKIVREEFVYEIADPKTAEQFFEATMHASPKKGFEELLEEHGLSSLWEAHQKRLVSNALINWMVRSGIELPGQALTQSVGVEPAGSVPDEMKTFLPTSCNSCGNTIGFKVSYFRTSRPCENLLMEKKAGEELKKQGFETSHFLGRAKKELIAASLCPNCKSSDLTWDFK